MTDTDPANTSSWSLLERLGMRREGHLRQSLRFKGQWADEYVYGILAEEWLARTADDAALNDGTIIGSGSIVIHSGGNGGGGGRK